VHVADLADAHLRAIERLSTGTPSQAINLGTGRGHSVLEVIESVKRVGGNNVPFTRAGRRAGDPPELVAAPARARDVLGWNCQYADLNAIVQHAWRWHDSRR
jgi:UDP-glucose 4-epimerase